MGMICSTERRDEKIRIKLWSGNLKSRDRMENTDVEGKAGLNRYEGNGTRVWIWFVCLSTRTGEWLLSVLFSKRMKMLKNKKPTRCHLSYLLYFLDTQHVSGINMSMNYHIGCIVLGLLCVGVSVWFGWGGIRAAG